MMNNIEVLAIAPFEGKAFYKKEEKLFLICSLDPLLKEKIVSKVLIQNALK